MPLSAASLIALPPAHPRDRLELLRDRRIPGTGAVVGEIAVAPSGVWVIETKDHRGEARIDDPLYSEQRLLIKGLDQTELLDELDRKVAAVRRALARNGPVEVPIHGAICFTEADFPRLRPLRIRGNSILWREELAKQLRTDGPLAEVGIAELTRVLGAALPSAYPARARR